MAKRPRKIADVTVLWSLGHYDGICTGIARHDGKPYYFKFNGSIMDCRERRYFLHPLTEDEFLLEDRRQEIFRTAVGWHCDYAHDPKTGSFIRGPSIEPRPEQAEVSAAYHAMDAIRSSMHSALTIYTDRAPIGYFTF